MKLTTKQKQDILDNAPEAATHVRIHCVTGGILGYDRILGGTICGVICYLNLEDMRKELDIELDLSQKQLGRKKAEIKRLHDEANESKGEWKNGDECVIDGYRGLWEYGCDMPDGDDNCIVFQLGDGFHMVMPKSGLAKRETAEQKANKERNEKAKELCRIRCETFGHRYNWDTLGEKKKEGYRKMIDAGVQLPS